MFFFDSSREFVSKKNQIKKVSKEKINKKIKKRYPMLWKIMIDIMNCKTELLLFLLNKKYIFNCCSNSHTQT